MIPERLQELVELGVGEELSAAEAAELRGLVEGDPTALDFFVRETRLSLMVAAQLRVGAGMPLAQRVRSVSEADRPSRRARIVSSIAARTRGRRRPIRIAALVPAVAAILVIAIGAWVAMRAATPAAAPAWRVVAASDGRLLRRDATEPLAGGMALRNDDELSARGSGCIIAAADGSTVALRAGTRVRIDGDAVVAVLAGSIHGDIAHQPPGRTLRFTADGTRIDILGTSFAFGFEPVGILLAVERGSVAFKGAGDRGALVVRDGEQALAQPQRPPRMLASATASRARTLVAAGDPTRWSADASRGSAAALDPAADADGTACVRFTATIAHVPGVIPWATLTATPVALRDGDRALRLRLRVDTAHPATRLCIDLTDRDHDVWRIASWPVAASGEWDFRTIPIPSPGDAPLCIHPRSGSPVWDPAKVAGLTLVVFGGSSVCSVGELGADGE